MYMLDEGAYCATTGLWRQFAHGIEESRDGMDVESGGYLYCRPIMIGGRFWAFAGSVSVYQPADYLRRTREMIQIRIRSHHRILAQTLSGQMPVDLHTHPSGDTLKFSPSDRNMNRDTRRLVQSLAPGMPLGIGVVDHSLDPAQSHLLCMHKLGHIRPMALVLVDSDEPDAFALWSREGADLWQHATVYRPDPTRVGPYQFEPTYRELAIDFPLDLCRTVVGAGNRLVRMAGLRS